MANRTVKDAVTVKGTNPQYLVEKIIRTRIYDCRYWKEECFALTAELLVDKAMELKYIGGVYGGNIKPTPFLCLILKMLQIQPEKDIIVEFIRNEDYKYVRFLGAFYMRLTGTSVDVYKYLEPLYIDYRKMKRLNRSGKFEMVLMDDMIDDLLHGERVCDVALPRIQKRHVLEELNQLEIRISPLEENLDENESSESSSEEEEEKIEEKKERKKESKRRSRSRSTSSRNRSPSGNKKREKSKYVDYDQPDQELVRYKQRSPSDSRRKRSTSKSKGERESSSSHRNRDHHRDHHRDDERDREHKHKKKSKHKRSRSKSHSKERSDDRKKEKDRKDKHSR